MKKYKREIYDEDGDGVEDNVKKTYEELDDFYWPNNFNSADEIYNTHHGNLPGHVRAEEYEARPQVSGGTWFKSTDFV